MSQLSHRALNGTGGNITFSIDTFEEDEIKVYVDGVEKTNGGSNLHDYTIPDYATTGGTVTWNTTDSNTAPSDAFKIRIVRETDVLNQGNTAVEGRATYSAGSSIKFADLNNNQKQVLRALQEHNDQKIQTYDIDPDAVTTTEIKDETIVNANVSTSAAIAGTKVTPAFGSQNVSTSGTAATGALTVTGNIAVSGTVDGRDVAADGSKLDGVDPGAKIDQTSSDIKTLLASDNLTDAHLAANSVGTSEIKDDAVTNDQLANSIVSSISANTSKTTNQTHTGDVTGSVALTISNDAVTTAKILDNNVNDDKLSHTSVTPASYGSSTSIPTFTVNQQGRITAASGNTVSFDVVADTSPQLGGNLDVQAREITTSGTNQDITLTPTGSGTVTVKGTGSASGTLELNTENNALSVKIQAPTNTNLDASDDSYTLTLPVNNGDNGQFLKTDGLGVLSWDTVSGGGGGGGTAAPNNIVTISESVDGSRTDFSMSVTPASAQNLIVSVNGVVQKPNAGTTIAGSAEGYCVSSATLKFATAPANGSSIFITEQSATVASDRITEGNSNVDVFDDNSTSRAVVNLDGNEKFRINEGGQIGLAGANYGTDGQVLTSQGSGAAAQWETIPIEVANDTSPQLGGNLDVQASEITTSTTNGNIKFTPNGTGVIEVKGAGGADGTLQLNCSQNSHGVKIKSPAHSASASYTLTLPVNDGSANQVLKTDGSGVLAWVDQTTDTNTTDLVTDTSPQLGGDLQSNGNDIDFAETDKATFGTDQDLQIYHQTNTNILGTSGVMYLHNTGASATDLDIRAQNDILLKPQNGEQGIKIIGDGAVELYYDGVKKFETGSLGVRFFGNLYADDNEKIFLGSSHDLEIYHDSGGNTYIKEHGSGSLVINADDFYVQLADGTNLIKAGENNSVDLFYNGSKKFETHNVGTIFTEAASSTTCGAIKVNTTYDLYGSVIVRNQSHVSDTIAAYEVENNGSGANETNFLIRSVNLNSQQWSHGLYAAKSHRFNVESNTTPKVQIDSDGLKFNNDQSSANALDDYEEGTWTPDLVGSSGGSDNWSTREGTYTKIGNRVFARFSLQSYGGDCSGNLHIAGLPFNTSVRQYYGDFGWYRFNVPDTCRGAFFYTDHSQSSVYLYWSRDNESGTNAQGSEIMNSAYLEGTINYQTNS